MLAKSDTSAILPCPFCGSTAMLGHVKEWDRILEQQVIVRMKVQCTGPGCWATIEDWIGGDAAATQAVKAWNTRVGAPKQTQP